MMTPRSYLYSSPSPTEFSGQNEKVIKALSGHERKSSKATGKKEKTKLSKLPPKMFTPPPPTPSKPVVIPTRVRDNGRRNSRESLPKDKRHAEAANDSKSTPSSKAAFLPMTTLAEAEDHIQLDCPYKVSSLAARKVQDAKLRDKPRRSISSSSPRSWGMLLSPPEDTEQESSSFASDTTLGPSSSSFRSLSTESMPSLGTDTESLSSVSNPATPAVWIGSPRANSHQHRKSLSISVEDCALDHPLLLQNKQIHLKEEPEDESPNLLPPTPSPLAKSRSYFKSNLTASFRKIRSAAQSFSAFASPPQREDYLARTLFSMDTQFTDERRPPPSTEPPDPALRRYLNPTTFSPAELHFHSEESPQVRRRECTASIQLQTYQGRHRASDKASSPPIFTSSVQKAMDAVDSLTQSSLPRQREPRENSDFLRVIVLEMNMRKRGKLSDTTPGRARLWLPARQAGKMAEEGTSGEEGRIGDSRAKIPKIPARWACVQA